METILNLLSGGTLGTLFGGFLRLIPEIFKMITARGDREHEYRMTKLQIEIDSNRAAEQRELISYESQADQLDAQGQAYIEAIKGQEQLTGNKWIDGLNKSVRPVLTYWWMFLYSLYKTLSMYIIWTTQEKVLAIILPLLWTEFDMGVFGSIIGFWFVDRAIRKPR